MPQTWLLGEAARQLSQDRTATWCRWRQSVLRRGFLRAELRLLPGARSTPIPGQGVLRPMWDIDNAGLNIAVLRPAAGTAVVTAGMHQAGS
ncbi:hypothetical protein ACFWDI_22815 [Streptomyces sp. NPDC060064]|uniref:hypothetical protein n=1 Tax=Streptomyces sp. NPDC060064 TaxID=3347049 RepID=UPI0036AFEFC7